MHDYRTAMSALVDGQDVFINQSHTWALIGIVVMLIAVGYGMVRSEKTGDIRYLLVGGGGTTVALLLAFVGWMSFLRSDYGAVVEANCDPILTAIADGTFESPTQTEIQKIRYSCDENAYLAAVHSRIAGAGANVDLTSFIR